MKSLESHGFSLLELSVAVLVLGLLFAFSIPAFTTFTASYQLKSTTQNIAGQLRLAREKAIATGAMQTLRFMAAFQGSDYHVWDGTTADPKWSLPRGITYCTGIQTQFRMTKDGRCQDSGLVMVQDRRGNRDTVSVQLSGLVLVK